MTDRHDALLLLSFGGPEGPDDVMPFLENVTRGRGIPRERLLEVAQHYQHFGGVSPINAHNRTLLTALEGALAARGISLPLYWGNRNWHPLVTDVVARMKGDGVRRALAIATSAFGSYSGCRQYREDLEAARAAIEDAPQIDKLPPFSDHPGFVEAQTDRVREALERLEPGHREAARLVFTAHSVPLSMTRGSPYVAQLEEAARRVAEAVGHTRHDLVWQSRSGAPSIPWLEPDVGEHLDALADQGITAVVIVPLGFLSDHMEVVWDLDHQARDRALARGLAFVRAGTVGAHPRFVEALAELVAARLRDAPRTEAGSLVVLGETCGVDCCPRPARPAARP